MVGTERRDVCVCACVRAFMGEHWAIRILYYLDSGATILTLAFAEVLKEGAVFDHLSHDKERLGVRLRTHPVQLDEAGMTQAPHHLSLTHELLHLHAP